MIDYDWVMDNDEWHVLHHSLLESHCKQLELWINSVYTELRILREANMALIQTNNILIKQNKDIIERSEKIQEMVSEKIMGEISIERVETMFSYIPSKKQATICPNILPIISKELKWKKIHKCTIFASITDSNILEPLVMINNDTWSLVVNTKKNTPWSAKITFIVIYNNVPCERI